MRPAAVSVAVAAFVGLSDAGQADKAALRSIRSRVMGVGVPPPASALGGVGATLLTAGPRARTQCGGGTGAPTGHGKRLSLHAAVERPDWPNARGLCVRLIRSVVCVYGTKAEWPGVSNVWERFSGIKKQADPRFAARICVWFTHWQHITTQSSDLAGVSTVLYFFLCGRALTVSWKHKEPWPNSRKAYGEI